MTSHLSSITAINSNVNITFEQTRSCCSRNLIRGLLTVIDSAGCDHSRNTRQKKNIEKRKRRWSILSCIGTAWKWLTHTQNHWRQRVLTSLTSDVTRSAVVLCFVASFTGKCRGSKTRARSESGAHSWGERWEQVGGDVALTMQNEASRLRLWFEWCEDDNSGAAGDGEIKSRGTHGWIKQERKVHGYTKLVYFL